MNLLHTLKLFALFYHITLEVAVARTKKRSFAKHGQSEEIKKSNKTTSEKDFVAHKQLLGPQIH